jgi:hypothetical protein
MKAMQRFGLLGVLTVLVAACSGSTSPTEPAGQTANVTGAYSAKYFISFMHCDPPSSDCHTNEIDNWTWPRFDLVQQGSTVSGTLVDGWVLNGTVDGSRMRLTLTATLPTLGCGISAVGEAPVGQVMSFALTYTTSCTRWQGGGSGLTLEKL